MSLSRLCKNWFCSVAAMVALSVTGCGDDEKKDENTPPEQNLKPDDAEGPKDTDLVVVRLNADGTVDDTFGQNGLVRVDLGAGAGNSRDNLWNVGSDAMDRILLFGGKKADGARSDTDRVVVRLNQDGTLDTTFNKTGISTLAIATLNDNARAGVIQEDGKIVTSGYMSAPTGVGTQSANVIVLLRLNDDGTPDTSFGSKGIVVSAPFKPSAGEDPPKTEWGMVEAYGVAIQNGKYVTTGYGRSAPSGRVDLVSFRYNADGSLDSSYGPNGVVFDIAKYDDRGRAVLALDDNRIVYVGSGTDTPPVVNGVEEVKVQAMISVRQENGAESNYFDPSHYKLFDFGRKEQAFFGVAESPDKTWFAAAGYRTNTEGKDEDGIIALMPAASSTGSIAKEVPLSAAESDRLWGVTFDANGRAIATGFVNQGGDTLMVVARFNADGNLDTTFGTNGMTTYNATVGGGTDETARSVVVQKDGKIIIAGVAEHH